MLPAAWEEDTQRSLVALGLLQDSRARECGPGKPVTCR